MSDLVEKVASRLARTPLEQCDDEFRNTPFWGMCEADARLAIAAVAEWLDTQGDEQWYPGERLREQLEQPK